ncbi:unnamed protein product [Polarella glacialis]|uniref:Uncharacterized protein n=1 Tax=Polarella glacialis TaxID=89957 RepID=A0A813ETP2_POLGL|nr:unnamed protein product [Polarella glacialis]
MATKCSSRKRAVEGWQRVSSSELGTADEGREQHAPPPPQINPALAGLLSGLGNLHQGVAGQPLHRRGDESSGDKEDSSDESASGLASGGTKNVPSRGAKFPAKGMKTAAAQELPIAPDLNGLLGAAMASGGPMDTSQVCSFSWPT